MKGTLRERLLARTVIDLTAPRTIDDAPCWTWTGRPTEKGYGKIGRGGAGGGTLYVHRAAYELWFGPIPTHDADGQRLTLDHLCRNTLCLNPAHLELVLHRTNLARGNSPGATALRTGHCIHGHEYDAANTYIAPKSGKRTCRACRRAR